ncbi:MAG TPA: hypothetical protein VJ848_00505 [Candidatus Angelobacter sp.]|nr:hypothetical protein [Candidatus Angelobacter sp.]
MCKASLRCTRVTLQIGFRAAGLGLATGGERTDLVKQKSRQEPVSETSSAAM